MSNPPRVAVLGGGSWGTALMSILLQKREPELGPVGWYLRDPGQVAHLREHGHNPRYLSTLILDTGRIRFYTDLAAAVAGHDVLIIAIPSSSVAPALEGLGQPLTGKVVVSAIKGIIPGCNHLVSEYFQERHGVRAEDYAVISGPCHSEEVAMEKLSYLTVAAGKLATGNLVARLLECAFIRTSVTLDVAGTEYSMALKNIMAIAAGIADGLGYGDNFQAVLISNAIREMKAFLHVKHPQTRDIKGSAYLGDLLVTAYSLFSRNRTFGAMVGKGYPVRSALMEMGMAVEGYSATRCIHQMNRAHGAPMPITEAVYNILYENRPPAAEMRKLSGIIR